MFVRCTVSPSGGRKAPNHWSPSQLEDGLEAGVGAQEITQVVRSYCLATADSDDAIRAMDKLPIKCLPFQ
jgi:hypothetical protein